MREASGWPLEIGIEAARAKLGDLADAALQGQTTYLTRRGRRVAAITPVKETPMTTHTAAVATTSDATLNGFCDVGVAEDDVSYYLGPDGDEVAEHTMSGRMVLDWTDTDVRADDPDSLSKAPDAADRILAEHGWVRVEDWSISDNAMYAQVRNGSR
jgi:prevent-host-death family protein